MLDRQLLSHPQVLDDSIPKVEAQTGSHFGIRWIQPETFLEGIDDRWVVLVKFHRMDV